MREPFSRSFVAFSFRLGAAAAAMLVAFSIFLKVPYVDTHEALFLILAAMCAGFAAVIDYLGALGEELRELNGRLAVREQRTQAEKKASTADTASES